MDDDRIGGLITHPVTQVIRSYAPLSFSPVGLSKDEIISRWGEGGVGQKKTSGLLGESGRPRHTVTVEITDSNSVQTAKVLWMYLTTGIKYH